MLLKIGNCDIPSIILSKALSRMLLERGKLGLTFYNYEQVTKQNDVRDEKIMTYLL